MRMYPNRPVPSQVLAEVNPLLSLQEVDAVTKDGTRIMAAACEFGDYKLLSSDLIERGTSLSSEDLCSAVYSDMKENRSLGKYLLEFDILPGCGSLIAACQLGDYES